MPVYLPGLTFGGLGYGGASYGYSPYGSGVHPRLPVPTTGGYGGAPYGFSSYGSVDITPPRVTGVQALDGYRAEVFFSEEMANNAALVAAGSYTFVAAHGVAITAVSVAKGTSGSHGGYTSVIVTHTGSTLGGQYTLTVAGPTDIAGNPVGPPPTDSAAFYAFGDTATVAASLPSPDDGRTVRLDFTNSLGAAQALLTEAEFTPGVDATASYGISTSYPVAPFIGSATQDPATLSRVDLDVHPMTSTTYTVTAGPSLAYKYQGLLLPDDDPTFTGVEIGTGTSVATTTHGLLLTKGAAVQYGWGFGDTTGRMITGTTFQAGFTFDPTSATITPAVLNSTLATLSVSDGVVQINLTLSDSGGVKVIGISSGAYTASVAAAWDTGEHSVVLIRNQRGTFYTVLFDGEPLHTFSSTTPGLGPAADPAGTAFVLSPAHSVSLFKLKRVGLTATTTLFTSAWNFIHGLPVSFTGSDVLTGDRIKTHYGPLVRGWGDATPATKEDVEVRLDGGTIEIAGVNPYVGEIYPVPPIPLAAGPMAASGTIEIGPGQPVAGAAQITVNSVTLQEGVGVGWANGVSITATATAIAAAVVAHCGCQAVGVGNVVEITALSTGVAGNLIGLANTSGDPNVVVSGVFLAGGVDGFAVEVDYIWFVNPAMEMSGLNTRGLTLNTWDRAVGHTAGDVSPLPDGSTGTTKTNRFPMGVALGPYERKSPKRIAHKYIGWQMDYSALTNQPTTLLLNQNPHAISVGALSVDALSDIGIYDGQVSPPNAPTPWQLDGVDTGHSMGDGTYSLVDASTGPYGIGTAAFYKREADLSITTSVTDTARFRVVSYVADGVFTGVALGLHDGAHLVLVGALVIDGVSHVGVLLDATKAHLEEGWEVGPSVTGTGTSQTTFTVPYADLPSGIESGDRFRIASGTQAGVYTIAECGLDLDSDTLDVEVTITTSFPANVTEYGSGSFKVYFETPWATDLISFRLYCDFPTGSAQAHLGGGIAGLIADVAEVAPFPAQSALLLPATEKGVLFWGSVSRRATSTSIWDLTQYSVTPALQKYTAQGITALTEMGTLPQDDPNDPWYIIGDFGYAEVDASGDHVLLKSTSGDTSIPLQFAYERVEPFLTSKVRTDSEATFRVESGILGAGDATFRLRDGQREVLVNTLIYLQTGGNPNELLPVRPNVSLSGLQAPASAGWLASNINSVPNPFVRGQTLQFTKATGQVAEWTNTGVDPLPYVDEGAIIEGRFSVESHTVGSYGIGIALGGSFRLPASVVERKVVLTLGTGTVDLRDRDGVLVQSFAYAWDDKAAHTYRVLCDPVADLVVLVIDDVVVGSTPMVGFSQLAVEAPNIYLTGFLGFLGTGACAVTLGSFHVVPLRAVAPTGTKLVRTFGVLLRGGDDTDLDSYRIPRTDGTTLPNSNPAVTVEEMDWRDHCRVRAFLDPTWGVSVYRPDLPLPPGASEDFITETTDPSAAWINVEYRDLPSYEAARGSVTFGALNRKAITQQRWASVRYRIRGAADGFGVAPQGMVLNQAVTLTSGEYNLDATPETRVITSRSPYSVYIPDSAIYADRVFVVQVDGSIVAPADWDFDSDTQYLKFQSTSPLPSDEHAVTVTFVVGKPVTKTYLCSQPIDESVTVLNEGTPPIPTGRDEAVTRAVEAGSEINDPADVLDSAESMVLNDPYRVVTFTETEESLYADLQFCETEDGESVHLSTICDGPGPGAGLSHIGIDGHFTVDDFTVPEGPAGPWGGSSPVFKGSSTHFDPATVLVASGGFVLGGNLGPGTAILYPNQRGPSGLPPEGGMGINQDFVLRLEDVTPREEDLAIQTLLGDNVPPTYADPTIDPNPDGVPTGNGHGACAYTMVDRATVNVSRLGPWGANTWFGVVTVLNNAAIVAGDTITFSGLPLTASAAPGTDEFLIGADAAETVANIRDAVNDTSNSFVGLCHAQVDAPPTTNQVSISSARELTFALSNGVAFQPNPATGFFSKRSLLGGGAQLDGFQFILVGGSQLPTTTVVTSGYIRSAN